MANFGQGHQWDAQRIGGTFHSTFVNVANVNIGLYEGSAGLSESAVLNVTNAYAWAFSNFRGPLDSTYKHLPAANVFDIHLGFTLSMNGMICSK